ncbi:MAG: hypothetical protein Q4G66_10100 [bacterium]|nr:hypothetical protein [bacterium]
MNIHRVFTLDPWKKWEKIILNFFFVFIILTISSIICLLIGEFFLRWYYKDVLSTATGFSYFSEKSSQLFSSEMNGYGLRGVQISPKHDGRYRIVVQGDSFTYGQGVYPASKRFTEILNKKLDKEEFFHGVVVFNAGICGFNLDSHIKFQKIIENFHPDFVLYQWFLNDMKIGGGTIPSYPIIPNKNIHKYLLKNSAIYTISQIRYEQFRRVLGKQTSFDEDMVKKFQDPNSNLSKEADELLDQLFHGYRSRGIDFGVVLFPGLFHDLSNYKFDFIHERILAACRKYEVKCLDLTPVYKGVPHVSLWANDFDAHPGVLAHEMAAKAIYDFYGDYWQDQAATRAKR